MWKFAFPSVQKAMQARTDKIRSNLDEAEKVRSDAQMILAEYQKQLADARAEANRIIEEARQAADQLRQDMVRRADEEVAELRRRNMEDLKAAQDRVMGQLQLQVRGPGHRPGREGRRGQLGPDPQPGPGRPADRGVGSPPRRGGVTWPT